MQWLERFVYNLVKNNSYLKNMLVRIYQLCFCGFGRIKGKIITKKQYSQIRKSFFGFHDRPSMNADGKVLSHVAKADFTNGIGHADIVIKDILTDKVSVVAHTICCNYQQGSLLTWFSPTQIIYNDANKDGPLTVIQDIKSGVKQTLPFHFFSVSPNSKYLSSVNFLRFGKGLEGYGYNINYPQEYSDDANKYLSTCQISDFLVFDVEDNSEVYRLSVQHAKDMSTGLIEDGYYYFSHSCFSPSSKKIYFLLRSSNNFYNTSQLFCYDLIDKHLTALASGGMVSHLSWLSDDRIIAFCNAKHDKSYGYYIFELSSNSVKKANIPKLRKDGHPHAIHSDAFYTDTYPDKERRQQLFYVNLLNDSVEEIVSVYSPLRFRGVSRVDFHPRLSLCRKYITIDSSHNSDRSQLILKL
ncbi:hypothetical protein [Shewanella sp. WPAGA9]|uniref:hypothetical protein n=1 Tax=Shewanella sp. ENK2 TaxID=2775245 RepID=UPI001780EC35|nr:hypothetical protein [Shewanella sp. WPAGA9]